MADRVALYSSILKDPVIKELDGKNSVKINELWNLIKSQITSQIVSQFGIAQMLDQTALRYENGGRVDTIHNVANGVEIKNKEAKERLVRNEESYETGAAHSNEEFQQYKKELHIKQNTGKTIIDDATGKPFLDKQTLNVDHIISGKSLSKDSRVALANINPEDEANQAFNYANINEGVNKSKGAKSNHDYALNNEQRVAQAKENIQNLDPSDPHYDEKLARNQGRIDADMDKMKDMENQAQEHVTKDASTKYYHSQQFTKDTLKAAGKQGLRNSVQQVWGLVMYEFEQILFDEIVPMIRDWSKYKGHHIQHFNEVMADTKKRLIDLFKNGKAKIFSQMEDGLFTGIISTIGTTVINLFATTTKNISRILNDSITGLYQGIKLLVKNPDKLQRGELLHKVVDIISTAVIASLGIIFTEYLQVQLSYLGPKVSQWVASAIGAIMTGLVMGICMYETNRLGVIFTEMSDDLKYSLSITAGEIKERYEKSVARIDEAYKELLNSIYNAYGELGKLADLAHDISFSAHVQLENSVTYAEASGVENESILHNKNEVDNYFKD